MRNLRELDTLRDSSPRVIAIYGSAGDDKAGVFNVRSRRDRMVLHVIASSGEGWDHVSVSRVDRCPTWAEMEQVKRMFFEDDETAVQFHVPPASHINAHPYCLHLWRPLDAALPRPPAWMVGPS